LPSDAVMGVRACVQWGGAAAGTGDGDELIIIVGAAAGADSYPAGCVLDRGARGRFGKWVGRRG